jgi:hypothetical protein
MFFDTRAFPFIQDLESAAYRIRDELAAYSAASKNGALSRHPANGAYTGSWTMCGVFMRKDDGNLVDNAENLPFTVDFIKKVPGIRQSTFSCLKSGAYIKPHVDPVTNRVRIHLGISVPENNQRCALRVAGQIQRIKTGQALMFDESRIHEAWNHTGSDRIVLFVDVDADEILQASGYSVSPGRTGKDYIRRFALPKTAAEKAAECKQGVHFLYCKGRTSLFSGLGKTKRFLLRQQAKRPATIDSIIANLGKDAVIPPRYP